MQNETHEKLKEIMYCKLKNNPNVVDVQYEYFTKKPKNQIRADVCAIMENGDKVFVEVKSNRNWEGALTQIYHSFKFNQDTKNKGIIVVKKFTELNLKNLKKIYANKNWVNDISIYTFDDGFNIIPCVINLEGDECNYYGINCN